MVEKVIFVSGTFNVLHPGHLRFLKYAREFKGKLVVGVISDKFAGKAAYIDEKLRLEGVSSINFIDETVIIHENIEDYIRKLKPDIIVKGKEHEHRFNIEKDILNEFGGKLFFSSGENILSSTDLIRKEFNNHKSQNFSMQHDFLKRHNIKVKRLRELLNNFANIKVCVIGDLIVDEYINCETLGMSQEDPSLVVTPIESSKYVGGAGIVSAHASGLGAVSNLFTIAGDDNDRKFAQKTLELYGVHNNIFVDYNRITTLKKRFRNKNKTLLKVSHLKQNSINSELIGKLVSSIEVDLNDSNLIIFSDFNYGVLPQKVVDHITQIASKKNIKIAADSQSSSQYGDVSRFKNMDLITPTEIEARLIMRNREDGLVVLADSIKSASQAKNILLKLGEQGMLIHSKDKSKDNLFTDQLTSFNQSALDTAGAGDSLLVCSALSLASGANIFEAAYLGSIGAGIQVSRLGNIPLKSKEIQNKIDEI